MWNNRESVTVGAGLVTMDMGCIPRHSMALPLSLSAPLRFSGMLAISLTVCLLSASVQRVEL